MPNLIDAQTLHTRLGDENVRVVDTRFALQAPDAGREAYEYAHLPGAVYFDLDKDLSSPPRRTWRTASAARYGSFCEQVGGCRDFELESRSRL